MNNIDSIVMQLFVYIDKYPILKIILVFAAIYSIFKFGKSVGEFIYYISQ